MKISSKLKKIISFFMAILIAVNVCVLPVWAYSNPAGEWDDNEWHDTYEDFSQCPKYNTEDLVYTGVTSENVTESFNIKKEYGLDWVIDSGCYMSQPFALRRRWNYGTSAGNVILNFETNYSIIKQLFQRSTFDDIKDVAASKNLSISDYDVYYTLQTSYSPSREYGYLTMSYIFVPKGHRIAISNENCLEGESSDKIKYGLWLSNDDGVLGTLDETYKQCWKYSITYGTESGSITKSFSEYKSAFDSFLGMGHLNLVSTNIPIIAKADNCKLWIMTGTSKEDPTNKIPSDSKGEDNGRISADAFGWNSFDCALVQDGNSYKFIYTYTPSTSDMKKNSSDYFFTADYSQNVKYRIIGQTASGELYKSRSSTMSKDNALDSGSSTINTFKELSIKVYDGSDSDGSSGAWFRFAINNLVNGGDLIQGSTEVLSSYIYITVTLKHKRYDSPTRNPNDPLSKVSLDISSDVRWFKFDALTGKKLDSSEVGGQVITKDSTDSDGNVITDSNGKPVKEVSQIITNDNSSHTTINNYYYNSDGKQSTSPDGSSIGDSLSDIASGLIKFIKTLVTEGLPAALEVLKTLIKSVSDLVGFAFDQIGDIGAGTSQGLIAVLKAIPTPLWGICSVGLIVFVIAGVLKKIF